ncbi:DUF3040 domain-containing protein [Amycolatopsis sp. OK19-0408]|uniref:DUF3040 domain-containing protein n=1 Tax=Amycolatopsis iheyensis TaxID=2945988 RepID=A0A9X2SPW7_9PSEU|nr:DUF3040 domain-containing protein [Amycolatopsis iheyensis]MCR6490642.1 DUF3040 domain-containing protein [Amycolatopsis iheyensis]
MLPDKDRRALRAIEDELRSTDPLFAETLSGARMAQAARWKAILILADVTAVLLVVLGIFAQQGWAVFWGIIGGGTLFWVHVARKNAARRSS